MAAQPVSPFAYCVQVPPPWRDAAARLLLEERSHEAREVLQSLTQAESLAAHPFDWLAACIRDGEPAAAAFCRTLPGKTAMLWFPRLRPGEPQATAARLIADILEALRGEGVRIVQGLPDPERPADEAGLLAAGFEHLTDLLYLVSVDPAPSESPPPGVEFEPYHAGNHQRFCRVVEATYQGTRDCPQLNGARDIEDVLAGYRASGSFDPARWLIVRQRGQDVGCLLLAAHPEAEQWELVYFGLAPAARGAGLGRHVVARAQALAQQARARQLVLAVDANNTPALALYAAAGFVAWDRRPVYLQIFASHSPADDNPEVVR